MSESLSGAPIEYENIMKQYAKEEHKLINHEKFLTVASKFWAVLPKDEYGRISKQTYCGLMRRIYTVLLPHYKAEEMEKEILAEWVFDCQGRKDLDFNLITKLLFRIVHAWAVHVDYEEYAFLLTTIYDRVTCKAAVNVDQRYRFLPKIFISFPEEEQKLTKTKHESGEGDEEEENGPDWEECAEDESPRSEFEYKYGDDNDTMDLKRYKRPKNQSGSGIMITSHIKDPFLYKETLVYDFDDGLPEGWTVVDQLLEEEYVIPLGYLTEQFLFKLKNDVYDTVSKFKEQNKGLEDELRDFNDPGDLVVQNKVISNHLHIFSNNDKWMNYTFYTSILDVLYNNFRRAFRECISLTLRLYPEYPNINMRAAMMPGQDHCPITEISKVGFNPCLDRRVNWELFYIPKKKMHLWLNQMYIIDHIDIQYAFQTKINKVKNKQFMVLKEEDGVRREEDFIPAETDYKKMQLFMLNKKFESLYSNRVKLEEKEQSRVRKQKEREEKKKKSNMQHNKKEVRHDPRVDEQRQLVKTFKSLVSKDGVISDNFVNKRDLIIEANKKPLGILVIGKPRSGKTRVSQDLSKSLDLVHIYVKSFLDKILKKVAEYEAPDDLEDGQEPPKFLSELEEEVYQALLVGKGPDDDQQVRIIAEMIASPEAQTKGYIIDLPFYKRKETWFDTISRGTLNMTPEDISYIIDLQISDNDIKQRAKGIRFDPETGEVVSKWERDLRRIPKKKQFDEDGNEIEEEDEVDDDPDAPKKPKILDEDKVLIRVKDLDEQIEEELQNYNSNEAPSFAKLIEPLYHHQYIKFDAAGVRPEVINDSLVARIKGENTLLRPIAIPLEGESDNKSYLSQGKEDGQLPRRWSLWKQTDPVALHKGKVVEGQTEFAASFNDRVFLFESEQNQKDFCAQPKLYLQKEPEMPDRFRLLLSGPSGAGKKTVAKVLADKYGWRIVDWNELITSKINMMRERDEVHLPNNPLAEDYKLGLSEEEWNLIREGKPYDGFNYMPWFYEFLGHETEKRRPPPKVEVEGEGDAEEEEAKAKLEEERKKKEEEDKKKEKEKKKKEKEKEKEKKKKKNDDHEAEGEGEEEEEEEPLEDINLADLDLKITDEEKLTKPFVGGFILIGFPQTAEHIEKLKANGIGFDKIIFLQDTNDENPGAVLAERMKDTEFYNVASELENSERILNIYKEQYEDIVNEISCNGSIDKVMARVYAAIDPFFPQVDSTDNVRGSDEVGDEDKPLPKGEYGYFCPVTLANDSWLYPGSEEFEAQVNERVYRLAGETELEEFKADPMKFVKEGIQRPPEPHIMIIGPKGSGASTQIELICEKYKVSQFSLKEEFLRKLREEKEKRKRQRLLARGFKAPEPADDDGIIPPDPEIEDDPDDFEKEAHEKEVFREILDAHKVLIFDGDWFDLPEDEITLDFTTLLFDSRRPPELVITLSVTEENMLTRSLDKDSIEAKYQELLDKLNEEKRIKREEDRAEKLQSLQSDEEKTPEDIDQEMDEWEKARDEEEEGAEDPDAPDLNAMFEESKEKLIESRNTQSDFIEDFVEKIKGYKVPVVEIDGNLEIDRVNLRILSELKPYIENRTSMFERAQIVDLKPQEVKFYENSYLFSISKYGYKSLFDISRPDMTKDYPLLYRDQIYFFYDGDEKEKFMMTPDIFCKQNDAVPKDVWLKPVCFVLGTPSCGKSTACQRINARTGMVHLRVEEIIPEFIGSNCDLGQQLRDQIKCGQRVSDELMVELISKRCQYSDCILNGFLLEDFPKNHKEAEMLTSRGIKPDYVFYLNMESQFCYSRVKDLSNSEFMYDQRVFSERLSKHFDQNPGVL